MKTFKREFLLFVLNTWKVAVKDFLVKLQAETLQLVHKIISLPIVNKKEISVNYGLPEVVYK